MEGEIRAAQQLESELKQCVYRLTRNIQLLQLQAEALKETRAALELEEAELLQQLKSLKETEAVHRRESAAIRETLAAKSAEFSEVTGRASEQLAIVALQRENEVLQARIRELKGQLEELRLQTEGHPDIDDATIALQLAGVKGLQRTLEEAVARHQRVESLVSRSLAAAAKAHDHLHGLHEDDAEAELQLEVAVEEMSQLLAARPAESLARHASVPENKGGVSTVQSRVELLTTRLSVERDRGQALLSLLTSQLAERIQHNRDLCPSSDEDMLQLLVGCSDQPRGTAVVGRTNEAL